MTKISFASNSARIGWIGTGVMGRSMCMHLRRAGHAVTVYTRTRERASELLDAGAQWADSPRSVAEQSDVVFSIVGFPRDVREVLLGSQGAVGGLRPGSVVVDMTTSNPQLAVEIEEAASMRQAFALDAPVSGGDIGAREARLSIMVGGTEIAFQAVEPLFAKIGKTIVHQGKAGAGQHTKMVNQILIAAGMVGVCESLLYAHQAGLNPELVLQSVSTGAAGSWSLTNLAPRILRGDFNPGFFVEHFVKDMGIALDECRRMQIALPGLALAHQLYVALQAQGHGRLGTQALELALASLSGITWPSANITATS
ncbi:MAG: NAD(P)-dependent oxidoreductase [Planctomycetota bacterium]|nr:NAD(P)-dependent oxidoreductase [Planctomycetota bacterium]MDA1178547.1 NAD(P)-dependent oxidoreductase [Planctomycetota bacterium]